MRPAPSVGMSLLNKRVGVGTPLLFAAKPGDTIQRARPTRPAVCPGGSADRSLDGRRGRRPRTVLHAGRGARRARHEDAAVLWRAVARPTCTSPTPSTAGRRPGVDDRRRHAGRARSHYGAADACAAGRPPRVRRHVVLLRPDADDARGGRTRRGRRTSGLRLARAGHGVRHGRLLQLRGARAPRRGQHVRARRASTARSSTAAPSSGTRSGRGH